MYYITMLNPFPELLTFSLLAPFLIRVILGILFISSGYFELKKNNANLFSYLINILKILGGLILLAGFLTQIASIVLSVIALETIIIKFRSKSYSRDSMSLYIFMFIATISLLVSGAGAFAIDLPL